MVKRAIAVRVALASKPGDSLSHRRDTDPCQRIGVVHNFADLKRSAFRITETELKLIAAPAIIGLRSSPNNG